MTNIKDFFTQYNFLKLFAAFFFSEFGGFLTNTVILFHLNKITNGDFFYLGLSQALFVLPLALGTLMGGAVGEAYNKKKVMIICEIINFLLIISMVMVSDYIIAIIAVRAFIVFSAGMYNPCRQAIVQEVISKKHLKNANASFTASIAIFHAASPFLGAALYAYFGGVKEIFLINVITYLVGTLFLFRLKYQFRPTNNSKIQIRDLFSEIKIGIIHVKDRPDLSAILLNFALGGIALGMFYPTVLPFIKDVFGKGEQTYAQMMLFISIGAILGAVCTTPLMKIFTKGKILVIAAFLQAIILFSWTQASSITVSFSLLFIWGYLGMIVITTYINYVQVNVQKSFRTRTFSILDQSVSMSAVFGALIVMMIGNSLSAKETMMAASIGCAIILLLRCFGSGLKSLFLTRT